MVIIFIFFILINFNWFFLFIDENVNPETILNTATKTVHTKYDFFETTLQIEVFKTEMEDCGQCVNPLK